ncbi:MAG: carbohydrate ABC transporter permease [Ruthenibacterium sp.]
MKQKSNRLCFALFCVLSVIVLFPMVYMVANSLMSPTEVSRYYYTVYSESANGALLHLLPDVLSLESLYQVFLRRPDYLIKFWNSLFLCGAIVAGQAVVSSMGGFAFAKYKFKGQNVLFFLLIIMMMMPVQVTLVPNYIVLDKLHLLGGWAALILPAAFLPFGTFLMTQIFKSIPDEILDAARLDGAGTRQILMRVLIPAGKGGFISLVLLSFIDAWNMVEQPMVFLKEQTQYPLSVFLASVNSSNFSLSFACGILAMLPVLLLFLFFNEELVEGIEFSGLK